MTHPPRTLFRFLLPLTLTVMPILTAADVQEGDSSVNITITNTGVRELPPESETRLRVFVHQERPSHNTPLPTCQPTQNDANETYDLTGWHIPTGGMTYLVNADSAPSAIKSAVPAAIETAEGTWTAADGDKVLTYGGTFTISRPRYDGQNIVMWRRLSRGTVAAAYIWYLPSTGEVVDADMVFNTRVRWSVNDPAAGDCGGTASTYDVQAVATHEFGHWFGLEDLYNAATADLTMHGIVMHTELKKASLGTGDTLGANAVAP